MSTTAIGPAAGGDPGLLRDGPMTTAAITDALGANRHGVRKAAQRLRDDGVLESAPGVGSASRPTAATLATRPTLL